ncbi:MAG: heat-inducible transcriptional repressor HrcA [bacterium]
MSDNDNTPLGSRAELVLMGLISKYISDGSPVGSRTLSRETELALSPATIRNVMSDLEEHGLIDAPHTSAGRVPTPKGYRFFINCLMDAGSINQDKLANYDGAFSGISDPKSILTSATEMLSQITSFAGMVSTPSKVNITFRQIEFLKLSKKKVLAILITNDGQVQNRVLSTNKEYSDSELIEAANFFNATYGAWSLDEVRTDLARHMQADHRDMHREMRTAIRMAGELFESGSESETESVLVSGENNLLAVPDFSELEKIKELFDTFKTKQVLYDLLQKSMSTSGVQIFIGEESGYKILEDCSVIAAPYEIDSKRVGVLGVIGPTRMQYDEVISAVDITARLLGSALSNTTH